MIASPTAFFLVWGGICASGALTDIRSKWRGGDGSEGAAPFIFVAAWLFLTGLIVVKFW